MSARAATPSSSPTVISRSRPEFLRATLAHLRSRGIDIITMDEVHRRLTERDFSRRFACFTLDDGYRDNRDFALPVMREFDAPFTVYVASDFAEGTRPAVVDRAGAGDRQGRPRSKPRSAASRTRLDTSTPAAKQAAFDRLHDWLRALPGEQDVRREIAALCARHGVDEAAIGRELCMSWDELKAFADDPLVTIGAHTRHAIATSPSRPRRPPATRWRRAARGSRAHCSVPCVHFAYPYGDKIAAGPREFALARSAGFKTAVTTRPGMIFPESAAHLTALPRVSLNGNYQDARILPVLTSGAATAMWNGFRRVDAA